MRSRLICFLTFIGFCWCWSAYHLLYSSIGSEKINKSTNIKNRSIKDRSMKKDYCLTNEGQNNRAYVKCLMSGDHIHLKQDDKRAINYVKETGLVEPPSVLPYNLTNPDKDTAKGPGLAIRNLIVDLNIKSGFYVECGAYDGEYISNTLYLERNLSWKGLLVETNPLNYEMLQSKNRKAWLSKACLSIKPYPHRARFLVKHVLGKVLEMESNRTKDVVDAQCVPLFTLLSAIKVRTVDFFSLDVEGSELQVLKTIPFDKLFIKILAVEFSHAPTDELLGLMKSKGYVEIGREMYFLPEDFLFVHEKVIKSSNKLRSLLYHQSNEN